MQRMRVLAVGAIVLLVGLLGRGVGAQTPAGTAVPQETTPESAEVQDVSARALRAQVLGLFESGQFGQIEALAAQLRSQKLRFRGGGWQLQVLDGVIDSPGSVTATDAEWEAWITTMQGWIAASPSSPTPRIALADGYLKFAWKARGNGYGDTVTQDGRTLFIEQVAQARTTLEEARALSVNCPEWYRSMQTVALAQGWPRDQEAFLAKAAMAHDPEFYYFALSQANYLLPKWYGKPGDTEAYAAQVADTVGGQGGDALYFLVAERTNCCRRVQAPAMDEARVQRGFAALDQLYGSTNHERNAAAYLALQAGDMAAAQALFARIGNDYAVSVWGTKARFDASRLGQPVGNVQPVGVPTAPPAAAGAGAGR